MPDRRHKKLYCYVAKQRGNSTWLMHKGQTLRCAALGVVAAGVRLRLFSTMVDSVLSHGAEVWVVQLVAAAVAGNTGAGICGSRSAAEARGLSPPPPRCAAGHAQWGGAP